MGLPPAEAWTVLRLSLRAFRKPNRSTALRRRSASQDTNTAKMLNKSATLSYVQSPELQGHLISDRLTSKTERAISITCLQGWSKLRYVMNRKQKRRLN